MKRTRHPMRRFALLVLLAPAMFACGMILYYADLILGEPIQLSQGGVIGAAANVSLIGLSKLFALAITFGPKVLILAGLALPVLAAMFTSEQMQSYRRRPTRGKRVMLWSVACAETAVMLVVFVTVMDGLS